MSNTKKERIQSLTGIQVITFLLIFLWHADFPKPAIDVGARGCEILFLISGFFFAYNHLDEELTLKQNLINSFKRYLKYLPLHLLTLIAAKIIINNNYDLYTTILNGLLLQAWDNNTYIAMSYNGAAWFLSALLFCYFIAPFFNKIIKKYDNKILFISIFGLRFLVELLNTFFNLGLSIHTFVPVRLLEFVMGMLLCSIYLSFNKNAISEKNCSLFELLFSILYIVLCRLFNNVLPRSIFVLLFCPVLFTFAFDKGILSKLLSMKIFNNFKSIQFQFYMWHINVINFVVINFHDVAWYIKTPIMFVITIGVSLISKYIDKYVNKKVESLF